MDSQNSTILNNRSLPSPAPHAPPRHPGSSTQPPPAGPATPSPLLRAGRGPGSPCRPCCSTAPPQAGLAAPPLLVRAATTASAPCAMAAIGAISARPAATPSLLHAAAAGRDGSAAPALVHIAARVILQFLVPPRSTSSLIHSVPKLAGRQAPSSIHRSPILIRCAPSSICRTAFLRRPGARAFTAAGMEACCPAPPINPDLPFPVAHGATRLVAACASQS